MKKKSTTKNKEKTTKKKYKVVLEMGGKKYEGAGDTVNDALVAIPLDWTQIKYKGTIKIVKEKKEIDKFFCVRLLKRLFANKLNRYFIANQLEKLLKINNQKPPK